MNQDREFRPSPIDGLSVELVRMILSVVPDVASLQAAALSCPLFYRAFLEAETAITAQVLLNQIDISVLPEAMAASESSSLRPHDTEPKNGQVIVDFVTQNLRQRPTPPRSWSLRKALRLGRLHVYMDGLAKKFAMAALTKRPLNRSKSIATRQEICRIERALYRFEIYCNLFRESPKAQSSVYGEQKQLFFANFAPWENEQLDCIHDFLVQIVSPEHDIAWGAFHVKYGDRVDSPFIQHVLSLGLEKLHQIAGAETYEERYGLLYSSHCPPATDSFLHEGLRGANEQNDNIFLDDLTPEDRTLHIKWLFFADPDSGPADVWRWAHQEESWANWVYQENRHGEQIYMSGGTGWWSWGDQSKVRWRGGVMPGQGRSVPVHTKPNSLREARDMLTMMKLPPSVK
ncbi:hypothetical protein QBC33DRAFT_577229 [Phialemonium atrogriseum]|uniref:Uncharacterized protein n=1 Tax=Phialemonium atrogriseum TaxID=1093897 RepID=A0AAJ0C268_9PEZI|nr:uncharacterized protein QBC33DRAFT_577229 [Phialemonium atrogriseum]KAK1768774.1 hypothetical protein QBC33DRAFT_577229 [Phialemonium atrogriseum]